MSFSLRGGFVRVNGELIPVSSIEIRQTVERREYDFSAGWGRIVSQPTTIECDITLVDGQRMPARPEPEPAPPAEPPRRIINRRRRS